MAWNSLHSFLLLLTATLISSAPAEDRVLYLPGLDPQPTYEHYAGYLSATFDSQLFYWFVPSERNATRDPLVLWLNGGPGCSSLYGILEEVGPWKTKSGGRGLTWSEHRWNKIANMIFLESPQCVGYSYGGDGCSTNDSQVARDNHLALKDFFVKFPEYRNNEFYMTGESYAGIYVPTLASLIEDDPEINFKGISLGNSVADFVTLRTGIPYFAYSRGLLGTDMWNNVMENCCAERNAPNCFSNIDDPQCEASLREATISIFSTGINPYNVYDECYGGVPDSRRVIRETKEEIQVAVPDVIMHLGAKTHSDFIERVRRAGEKTKITPRYRCIDTIGLESYLNRRDVRAALHVSESADNWTTCSPYRYEYNKEYSNVRAEYNKVLQKGHRIVTYFGDLDMLCNHLMGMWFTESLGVERLEPLKRWFYEDQAGYNQIAGFVIQYDGLKFVSIKGAGHSAPVDKPLQAYMVFEKFLNDEPY